MSNDPYANGKFVKNPYAKKVEVRGSLVVVLEGVMNNRGLCLIQPISRCVLSQHIHELILTDEMDAAPGVEVNRIAYLGFCTIQAGGVLVSGDECYVGGRYVGNLVGFDETHMPNHLNIVLKAEQISSGLELGLELGDYIVFRGK